jgi:hypothetical protein
VREEDRLLIVEVHGLFGRVGRPLETQVRADGVFGFPIERDDPIGPRFGLRATNDEMSALVSIGFVDVAEQEPTDLVRSDMRGHACG